MHSWAITKPSSPLTWRRFKKHRSVQFERVVKKANTKSTCLSVAVDDCAKTRQDVEIRIINRSNATKRFTRRKFQTDKSQLSTASVRIIEAYIYGKDTRKSPP